MYKFNLEKEYHNLRVQYDQLFDQGSAAIAENVELRRQLAAANERAGRLEAALEWYANPNWEPQRGPDGEPCGCPAWEDNGAIARKALEVPDAL